MSTTWVASQVDVALNTPTATGAGDVRSVDAIGFMHKNTSTPGSGMNHEVYFDDFTATGAFTLLCRGGPILGDLNQDCYVNFADLAIMAAHWLECSETRDTTCDQY